MVLDVIKVSNVRTLKTSLSLAKMRILIVCCFQSLEDGGGTWWWGKARTAYISIAWKWRKWENRLILELNEWRLFWCEDLWPCEVAEKLTLGQEDRFLFSVREISPGQDPWRLHVSEALLLHLIHWSHRCGECYLSLIKRLGIFLLMKSSFPEQNRQFLPGSLQPWAVACW